MIKSRTSLWKTNTVVCLLIVLTLAVNIGPGGVQARSDVRAARVDAGGLHSAGDATLYPDLYNADSDLVSPGSSVQDKTIQPLAPQGIDDGSIVDVLVVWTDAAQDTFTDTEMEAYIRDDLAKTNAVMRNSDVDVRLILAHAQEITFTESSPSPNAILTDLKNSTPSSGPLQAAHQWRDTYHADVIMMIADVTNGAVGPAYAVGPRDENGSEFERTTGLLFEALPEWYEDATTPPSYAHAHVDCTSKIRTLMGNGWQCVADPGNITTTEIVNTVWVYSNPDLDLRGNALGVPDGTSDTCTASTPPTTACDADNSRQIDESAPTVSQLRTSQVTWTGAVNNDWDTAGNWVIQQGDPGSPTPVNRVPRAIDDVVIPNGATPQISSGTKNARDIVIQDGGVLAMTGGVFNVYGSITISSSGQFLGGAILTIDKVVATAHDPVLRGDALTYTIVISNTGVQDATGVVVTDTLPTHVTGTDLNETATVTMGKHISFTINATLSHTAPDGLVIENTAHFSHSSGIKSNSASFTVEGIPPNNAPNTPGDPSPTAGATGVSTTTTLFWSGGDPDVGDTVTYTVAFGDSNPPPIVDSNVHTTTYDPGALSESTTYYWAITATDGVSATTGPLWSFGTLNRAPNTPASPAPSDGATNVAMNAPLSWSGGDPDVGDTVTYTVAFGVSSPPTITHSNVSTTTYDPGLLPVNTTYYWQITSTDGISITTGPVWSFTTVDARDCIVFASTDTPMALADGRTVSSTLGITNSFGVGDVNVTMNISHTHGVELDVSLIAPDNTEVLLFGEIDDGGQGFLGVTLDDEASTAIISGTAPFTGSFRPQGNLGDFDGKSGDGDWRLVIDDTSAGNGGSLDDWRLELCPTVVVTQAPNVPSSPSPADKATGVALNTSLSWSGGDPDVGDTVTYTVAFGVSSPPTLTHNNVSTTTYDPSLLLADTAYYWQITSTDGISISAGPVWSFTTGSYIVFASTDTPMALADGGTVTSTLGVTNSLSTGDVNAANSFSIGDVNVTMNISHTHGVELQVSLIAPDDTKVLLFGEIDDGGQGFFGVTLDDEASIAIAAGTAPLTGSFRPQGNLSDFDGKSGDGDWRLVIADTSAGNGGSLDDWRLELLPEAEDQGAFIFLPVVMRNSGS